MVFPLSFARINCIVIENSDGKAGNFYKVQLGLSLLVMRFLSLY